ncbi:MAG: DsbA family oxidoreductase [Pseudomonadota bacterium]
MIKLDILSDPICPWCYIGKTQLDRALEAHPDHPFTIEWHPFQLNPDMPREGMGRAEYLERKFGGREGAVRVYGQIQRHADDIGLTANLGDIKRTPNTIDAHRLIHWSGLEAKQGPVVDALFKAYFVEGRDIGAKDVLLDVADSAGLDAAVIGKLLDTDEDVQMIRDRDTHSREMGVNSVPTFIVAQQHAVPGAQPPELWAKVIGELQEQLEAHDG